MPVGITPSAATSALPVPVNGSSTTHALRRPSHRTSSGEAVLPFRAEAPQNLLPHPHLPLRPLGLLAHPRGDVHGRRRVAGERPSVPHCVVVSRPHSRYCRNKTDATPMSASV